MSADKHDVPDRRHHPACPGFWLHPEKGVYEIGPDDHHSDFFLAHPELFGTDLDAAFADGWVSIRRWVGGCEAWAIRYDALHAVADLLCAWARKVVIERPDEALTPLLCFPISDTKPVTGNLGDLAKGARDHERHGKGKTA